MRRMRGGEAVVATLEANGVRLAFGMPGIHNLAVFDALLDRQAFRHILVRNEQGGSIMANGVGRTTGRPGVCVVTTGPAACNALTGVADAARDSVPMLVVASQIESHLVGQDRGAFHEVADQMGMFRAAGAFSVRANRVEQVPAAINAAWVAMTHGRPRPAYVEVPEDILFAEGEVEVEGAAAPPLPGVTPERAAEILSLILKAERPLVYAGGGVLSAGAPGELRELVELLGLPVVTTIHGKGALPEDHPLSGGVLPIGDPTCRALFSRADLVLALGTSFSQVSTGSWTVEFPAQLIHVDLDGAGIGRSVPAALKVAGDVRTVLGQLKVVAAAIERRPPSAWAEEVAGLPARLEQAVEGATGAELVRTMRCLLPDDAIVVGDAQGWGSWLIHHFPIRAAGRLLWPIHFGTLGFSVPGAIGVQAAFPERRVVAACGDGGFMFCSNELATAVQHQLDIVVIVVNDAGFGSVRMGQVQRFGAERVFAADLHNPDFVAYARSFGCWGRRVQRPEEFEPALKEALNAGRPAVVEVVFPLPRTPGDYGLEDSAEGAG